MFAFGPGSDLPLPSALRNRLTLCESPLLSDTPVAIPELGFSRSYMGQVKICLRRGFWRLKADPSLTLFQLFGNFVMALIVSSVFYNLPEVCRERNPFRA